MLTLEEVSVDSILQNLVGGNLTHLLLDQTNLTNYQNTSVEETQQPTHTVMNQDTISIENELKPALSAAYENITSPTASALAAKCLDVQYSYFEWNSTINDVLISQPNVSINYNQNENENETCHYPSQVEPSSRTLIFDTKDFF